MQVVQACHWRGGPQSPYVIGIEIVGIDKKSSIGVSCIYVKDVTRLPSMKETFPEGFRSVRVPMYPGLHDHDSKWGLHRVNA